MPENIPPSKTGQITEGQDKDHRGHWWVPILNNLMVFALGYLITIVFVDSSFSFFGLFFNTAPSLPLHAFFLMLFGISFFVASLIAWANPLQEIVSGSSVASLVFVAFLTFFGIAMLGFAYTQISFISHAPLSSTIAEFKNIITAIVFVAVFLLGPKARDIQRKGGSAIKYAPMIGLVIYMIGGLLLLLELSALAAH